MRALKFIPQYTVKDYQHWEGDWELIDGVPYAMNSYSNGPNAMSPSPMHNHQRLSGEIYLQIGLSIKNQKNNCGDCRVIYELDWIIDDNTVVRPDIAVICGKPESFITRPPVLIIEILSPATAYKDRHAKFEIYQEQGVNYYIIADADDKTYVVYSLIKGKYQEQNGLSDFSIHDKCKIHINMEEAFSAL